MMIDKGRIMVGSLLIYYLPVPIQYRLIRKFKLWIYYPYTFINSKLRLGSIGN